MGGYPLICRALCLILVPQNLFQKRTANTRSAQQEGPPGSLYKGVKRVLMMEKEQDDYSTLSRSMERLFFDHSTGFSLPLVPCCHGTY